MAWRSTAAALRETRSGRQPRAYFPMYSSSSPWRSVTPATLARIKVSSFLEGFSA